MGCREAMPGSGMNRVLCLVMVPPTISTSGWIVAGLARVDQWMVQNGARATCHTRGNYRLDDCS